MPAPFKNRFNRKMIALIASHLGRVERDFDQKHFVQLAVHDIEERELKERSNQIVFALEKTLSPHFREACRVMVAALDPRSNIGEWTAEMGEAGIRSWAIMPLADYVARHGLDDFDHGMAVLREMTQRFSAEFGVRPFLEKDPERALAHVLKWTTDENVHVRRLASEGTRPRLPWGIRLQEFDKDPTPVLPILESLKDDPEEYVRRSVANHLNDIAKSHPDLVADIARDWLKGADKNRVRLIRHGCRTLIKQGHPATLKALGYGDPKVKLTEFRVIPPRIQMGEKVAFEIALKSMSAKSQPLILDYVIHHQKANGTTSPKVFKWKTFKLAAGEQVVFSKKHHFKAITTRVYYSGLHQVEIQVNGQSQGVAEFDLQLE